MQKKSRLLQWIDWIYETVKLSFLFWKEAILHGGLFGFVEAFAITIEEADLLLEKEVLEEKSSLVPYAKVFSILFSALLILSFMTQAYLAEHIDSVLGLFLVTITGTAWTVLTVFLVSLILESRENEYRSKNMFIAEAILSLFRKPLRTFYIGSLLFTGFITAFLSPVLLFAVVPGTYTLLVLKGDESLKRKHTPDGVKRQTK